MTEGADVVWTSGGRAFKLAVEGRAGSLLQQRGDLKMSGVAIESEMSTCL